MNNLNDIKSKTNGLTPFTVPENYFEQLSGNIMSQLPEKNRTHKRSVSLVKRVLPIIYLAAMFAGIAWTVNVFVLKPQQKTTAENVLVNDKEGESVALALAVDDYSLYEYMNDDSSTKNY